MANRALIACSVSALALAIVTLYYWHLRKRRKLSSPDIDASNSSSQVEHFVNKVEEHCLDSSDLPSGSLIYCGESILSSPVSANEELAQEETTSVEYSGNDQSVETKKSTFNIDNNVREDDTEGKIVLAQSFDQLLLSELTEENLCEKQDLSLEPHLTVSSIPICSEKDLDYIESIPLLKTSDSKQVDNMLLQSGENLSPALSKSFKDSLEDEELACKAKLKLSLSEESATTDDSKSSNIELKNPSNQTSFPTNDDNEPNFSDEQKVCEINIPDIVKDECEEVIEASPEHLTADKELSPTSIEGPNECKLDDNRVADVSETSLLSKPECSQNSSSETHKPVNVAKREPRIYKDVKPGQTFAQVLSSKNGKSNQIKTNRGKSEDNVPLDITTGQANGSMAHSKDETDAYHGFPDSALNSSEGQCSPNSEYSDIHSQGSADSGKGGSEILPVDQSLASPYHIVNASDDQIICYQFEMPFHLCGKLIGSRGHYINTVKQKSNTQIVINDHYLNPELKICSITGLKSNVMNALSIIRRRFPLDRYPELFFQQINLISPVPTIPLSQACQLHIPPDINTDVLLSCTIDAGHFFLQQPTHPTYPQLSLLDYNMKMNYSQANAPPMPHVHPGIICAAPTAEGWYRALIKNVNELNSECDIMFVDYGGYAYNVPAASLRQIRYDFMSLPFQASECFLANVAPIDAENGWSDEANSFFEGLSQGLIIYATLTGYDENGTPFVNLFKVEGSNKIYINKELVEKGHGQWTEIPSPTSS